MGIPNKVRAARGRPESYDSRQLATRLDPAFLYVAGPRLTLSEIFRAQVSNKFEGREFKRSRFTGEATRTSFSL